MLLRENAMAAGHTPVGNWTRTYIMVGVPVALLGSLVGQYLLPLVQGDVPEPLSRVVLGAVFINAPLLALVLVLVQRKRTEEES